VIGVAIRRTLLPPGTRKKSRAYNNISLSDATPLKASSWVIFIERLEVNTRTLYEHKEGRQFLLIVGAVGIFVR
jgi:hypothetical protein